MLAPWQPAANPQHACSARPLEASQSVLGPSPKCVGTPPVQVCVGEQQRWPGLNRSGGFIPCLLLLQSQLPNVMGRVIRTAGSHLNLEYYAILLAAAWFPGHLSVCEKDGWCVSEQVVVMHQ